MWEFLAIVALGSVALALKARRRERAAAQRRERPSGPPRPFSPPDMDWQMPMRFRERLALVLFLAPLAWIALLVAGSIVVGGPPTPRAELRTLLSQALLVGAVAGGGAWTLVTVLKWLIFGRA